MSDPQDGCTQRLRDGRSLGYAEYGAPDGHPVFLFQGTPSSRQLQAPYAGHAQKLGARLLVPERPGFGLSDDQPGRRLSGWPDDVAQLADALGIERFAAAGISGGGPHALACGARIPERVTRIALVGSAGPVDAPGVRDGMPPLRRLGFHVARHFPVWLGAALLELVASPRRDADRFYRRFTAGFPEADRALLAQPQIWERRVRAVEEATRRGTRGFVREAQLMARPWDFAPEEVTTEVQLWHGERDASTPLAMAEHLAGRLPNARLRSFPGEGHFVALRHWEEILGGLLGVGTEAACQVPTSHPR